VNDRDYQEYLEAKAAERFCAGNVDILPTGEAVGCGKYLGDTPVLTKVASLDDGVIEIPLCAECTAAYKVSGLLVAED
jgi:hypothetical protein